MTKRNRYRQRLTEVQAWLKRQRAEHQHAAQVAAAQRKPVDGLHPVELPSVSDALDQVDFGGISARTPGRRVTPRDLPRENM